MICTPSCFLTCKCKFSFPIYSFLFSSSRILLGLTFCAHGEASRFCEIDFSTLTKHAHDFAGPSALFVFLRRFFRLFALGKALHDSTKEIHDEEEGRTAERRSRSKQDEFAGDAWTRFATNWKWCPKTQLLRFASQPMSLKKGTDWLSSFSIQVNLEFVTLTANAWPEEYDMTKVIWCEEILRFLWFRRCWKRGWWFHYTAASSVAKNGIAFFKAYRREKRERGNLYCFTWPTKGSTQWTFDIVKEYIWNK